MSVSSETGASLLSVSVSPRSGGSGAASSTWSRAGGGQRTTPRIKAQAAEDMLDGYDFDETDGRSYYTVDVFSFHRTEDEHTGATDMLRRPASHDSLWQRWVGFWHVYMSSTPEGDKAREPLLVFAVLVIVGVGISSVGLLINLTLDSLFRGRDALIDHMDGYFLKYLVWIAFTVGCALVSAAFMLLSGHAVGSGVPEMKAVLSGIVLHKYMSKTTLLAKIFGLAFAQGAELSVGSEGPFVHMASCICHSLLKFKPFRSIQKNGALRLQLLAAACAAGVSATFGAPIAGVLFSIEVTATYYMVSNLPRAYCCAAAGAFTLTVFQRLIPDLYFGLSSFFDDPIEYTNNDQFEFLAFVALGALLGLVGPLLVFVVGKLFFFRHCFGASSRFTLVSIVAIATALLTYPLESILNPIGSGVRDLFQDQPLDPDEWGEPSPVLNLVLFSVIKFCLTSVSVVLPIPAGIFAPTFELGGAIGRLFGEVLLEAGAFKVAKPALFAVAGAGALSCAVTGTLSPVVLVIELTGQTSHSLPLLLACLAAYFVGSRYSGSVYDVMLSLKGLPLLPMPNPKGGARRCARDVMRPAPMCIALDSTYLDAHEIVIRCPHWSVPIVENPDNMLLVGEVQRVNGLQLVVDERLELFEAQAHPHGPRQRHHAGHDGRGEALLLPVSSPEESTPILASAETAAAAARIDSGSELDESEWERVDQEIKQMQAFMRVPMDWATVPHDVAPLTVSEEMPMRRVDLIFRMLGLSHAWVVRTGKLVGVITKNDLIEKGY